MDEIKQYAALREWPSKRWTDLLRQSVSQLLSTLHPDVNYLP